MKQNKLTLAESQERFNLKHRPGAVITIIIADTYTAQSVCQAQEKPRFDR